jgi:hypothetical protein
LVITIARSSKLRTRRRVPESESSSSSTEQEDNRDAPKDEQAWCPEIESPLTAQQRWAVGHSFGRLPCLTRRTLAKDLHDSGEEPIRQRTRRERSSDLEPVRPPACEEKRNDPA